MKDMGSQALEALSRAFTRAPSGLKIMIVGAFLAVLGVFISPFDVATGAIMFAIATLAMVGGLAVAMANASRWR